MKQDFGIKANYTIYRIPAGSLDFLATEKEKIEYLKNNEVAGVKVWKWHNLVPKLLRKYLAQLISGSSVTPTFKANIIALGTDATIATYDDVQLGAEVMRSSFDNTYSVENVAYLDVYYSKATIWVVSLQEIWVFVDGLVGTPNSGYLLSRININEDMSGIEDLSINVSFTISW